MIRVFKSKPLREALTEQEQADLVSDFKRYKSGEVVPDAFGRDVPYDHLNTPDILKSEEVQHIHLLSKEIDWPMHTIQFSKTSDTHLVYCQGFSCPDTYLLMAILSPDAHEQAWSTQVMLPLGEMARNFRNKY